jgi:ribosomal protein L7/L12
MLKNYIHAFNYLISANEELNSKNINNQALRNHFADAIQIISGLIADEIRGNPTLNDYEKACMMAYRTGNGDKILAIKSLRARTSLGLKEAKDLVEKWALDNGYPINNGPTY